MPEPATFDDIGPAATRDARIRIVVMGGIGAGKSTVAALLAARGALVIEADRIGHEILEPGHDAHARVSARWPAAVTGDGRIDRSALGEIVFATPEELAELESITHPAIRAEVAARAATAGAQPVVVEIPLLPGWFGPEWVRILVSAGEETRLDRAAARGSERIDVRRRMRAQPGDDAFRRSADHVVTNDGTPEELSARVSDIWEQIVQAG